MNQIPNIEDEKPDFHMMALAKSECAKAAGEMTVVRLGYVTQLLEEVYKTHHHQLQKARQDWLRKEIEKLEEEQATSDTEENGYCIAIQSVINRYQDELNRGLNQEEMVEIVEHYSNGKLMSRKANGVNILLNHSELDQPTNITSE